MTHTIQDTVGRLAIAKENVTMGSKALSLVQQFLFQQEYGEREGLIKITESSHIFNLQQAIERLEMAIHDLKVVENRLTDG